MKPRTLAGSVGLALILLGTPLANGQESGRDEEARRWVNERLATMTLEEKIGQLIFPPLSAVFLSEASEGWREVERNITEFHVGGYHAFAGDPAALAYMVNRMQGLAPIPLLITADLEGGAGYQFYGATRLPRAMALAAAGSEEVAYEAGKIAALEGRAMGVGMNFYPVADVNNNPRNPIINIRSFGEDSARVAKLTRAYIRGAQDHGQLATAKHFPGHGDTSQDSHLGLAVIDVSRERLEAVELPPFVAAVEEGVAAVMTAHVYVPQLEPDVAVPATLSHRMTTELLRQELGFDGLVVTDALTMQGVAAAYGPEEVAVRAVKAGADILLIPVNVGKTFQGLRSAVASGEISEARIEASVRRILEAKARLGLDRDRFVDLEKLARLVGTREYREQARTMMEQALTLARDEKSWLPLQLRPTDRVLLINLLDSRQDWVEGWPGQTFEREFKRRHENAVLVEVDDLTDKKSFEVLAKLAAASDITVVNGFIRVAAYKGSIELNPWQLDFLRDLSALQKPFVFTLYGSPYLLSFVPELPTYILTYEYYPEAERAAVRAILGEIPFRGRLPISLPGAYEAGHGLTTQATGGNVPR